MDLEEFTKRSTHTKKILLAFGIALSMGVLALAFVYDEGQSKGRWYSLLPPLIAITTAFVTQRILLSLFAALITGSFLAAMGSEVGFAAILTSGVAKSVDIFVGTVGDSINMQILAFVALVLAFISVLITSGGLKAIVISLQKYVKGRQSSQLMTAFMGLLIFIDDYANTMIVGSTMRNVTDHYKVSREKLAFLVDATSAPVAGLAFISTWVGYEVGLFADISKQLNFGIDGYGVFFEALNFRFYCILMLVFVFLIAWSGWDFGPMAKAEKRARAGKGQGGFDTKTSAAGFKAVEADEHVRLSIWTAVVPIFVLLSLVVGGLWYDGGGFAHGIAGIFSFSVWRDTISGAENGILVLAMAALLAWVSSIIFAKLTARLPAKKIVFSSVRGFKGALLPISILLFAWALKGICDELNTGAFLASTIGDAIPAGVFPLVTFILAALTAFATGTSWGTMAILIPTLTPVAFALDGGAFGLITPIVLAAVLDGAIMGDHCSPISDTTIMSSIASSCNHMAHVHTQLPYSITVASIAALFGYVPSALGMSSWLGIGTASVLMFGFFYLKKQSVKRAMPTEFTSELKLSGSVKS